MEQTILQRFDDTFLASLSELNKDLVVETKELLALLNDEDALAEQQEQITELGSSLLGRVESIVMLIQSRKRNITNRSQTSSKHKSWNELEKDTYEAFLIDAGESLSVVMSNLVASAKAATMNPFDYLTRQKLTNWSQSVAKSLRNLVGIVDSIQAECELEKSKETGSSSQPQKAATLRNPSTESNSQNNSRSELSSSTDSVVVESDILKAIANAKQAIVCLNQLKEWGLDNNAATLSTDDFSKLLKELSSIATDLLITARTFGLNEEADRLKESSIAFIGAARTLFQQPEDEVFRGQFETQLEKTAGSLRNFVFAIKEVKTSIRSPEEEGAASPVTETDAQPIPKLAIAAISPSAERYPSLRESRMSKSSKELLKERDRILKLIEQKKKDLEEQEKKRHRSTPPSTPKSSFVIPPNPAILKPSIENPPPQPTKQATTDQPATQQNIQDAKQIDKKKLKEIQRMEKKAQKQAEKKAKAAQKEAEKHKKTQSKEPSKGTEKDASVPAAKLVKKDGNYSFPVEAAPDFAMLLSNELLSFLSQSPNFPKFVKEWTKSSEETKQKTKQQAAADLVKMMNDIVTLVPSDDSNSSEYPSDHHSTGRPPKEEKLHQRTLTRSQSRMLQKNQSQRFVMVPAREQAMNLSSVYSQHKSGSATSEDALAKQLLTTVQSLGDDVLDFIALVYNAVLDPRADMKGLTEAGKEIMEELRHSLECALMVGNMQHQVFHERAITTALQAVNTTGHRGKLLEHIIKAASGIHFRMVENSLHHIILSESNGLKVLAVQITCELNCIATQMATARVTPMLLQFAGSVLSFVEAKERLLDGVESVRYLSTISSANMESTLTSVLDCEDDRDVNIWEDESIVTGNTTPRKDPTSIKAGTLNRLVDVLASLDAIDNTYLKTFITTYQSFTDPLKLFEKLMQRYNVPENKFPPKTVIQIQQRVAVVLKYWVDQRFQDFDDILIEKVFDFYDNNLALNNPELAKVLRKELERKMEVRSHNLRELFSNPPSVLIAPDLGKHSLIPTFFFALNDAEIARQLTIIDFKLFEAIEPTELLNQAWNKNDLKYRAPNVLAMIQRANRLSFWVASLVLWMDNTHDRAKMIIKLMNIADELRKHNNFHTLMGFIAGLNNSAVSRLKKTMEEVSPQQQENFKVLEKLMSPTGSYKTYRASLKKAALPCLPYIGTYLSDLTFIEDGNPDMTKDHLINYQKRELVYNAIAEVNQYQQAYYTFPVMEPINTFLSELPSSSEKDLYDLSLKYEPRPPTDNKEKDGRKSKKSFS